MGNFDRLDRIEALLKKIGQRVDSNARAIEAISANTTEYQKDRAWMYQLMADLAQAQAEGKREMYRLLGSLEEQQARFCQQQVQFSHQQADMDDFASNRSNFPTSKRILYKF